MSFNKIATDSVNKEQQTEGDLKACTVGIIDLSEVKMEVESR